MMVRPNLNQFDRCLTSICAGQFVWGRAAFDQSARNIAIQMGDKGSHMLDYFLVAELRTVTGEWKRASINLDDQLGIVDVTYSEDGLNKKKKILGKRVELPRSVS